MERRQLLRVPFDETLTDAIALCLESQVHRIEVLFVVYPLWRIGGGMMRSSGIGFAMRRGVGVVGVLSSGRGGGGKVALGGDALGERDELDEEEVEGGGGEEGGGWVGGVEGGHWRGEGHFAVSFVFVLFRGEKIGGGGRRRRRGGSWGKLVMFGGLEVWW